MNLGLTAFSVAYALYSYHSPSNELGIKTEEYQNLLTLSEKYCTSVYGKLLLRELNVGNFDNDKFRNLEKELVNAMYENKAYETEAQPHIKQYEAHLLPIFDRLNKQKQLIEKVNAKEKSAAGSRSVVIGIVLIIVGIILSANTTRFFYGAILGGIVSLVSGFINMTRSDS